MGLDDGAKTGTGEKRVWTAPKLALLVAGKARPLNALQCFARWCASNRRETAFMARSKWGDSQPARCHALTRERAAASLPREDLIAVWSGNTPGWSSNERTAGGKGPKPLAPLRSVRRKLAGELAAARGASDGTPTVMLTISTTPTVMSTIPTVDCGFAAHGGEEPGRTQLSSPK